MPCRGATEEPTMPERCVYCGEPASHGPLCTACVAEGHVFGSVEPCPACERQFAASWQQGERICESQTAMARRG